MVWPFERNLVSFDYPGNRFKPRDYQRPAWKYLRDGGRHAELIWHRRAGKDEIGMWHAG